MFMFQTKSFQYKCYKCHRYRVVALDTSKAIFILIHENVQWLTIFKKNV